MNQKERLQEIFRDIFDDEELIIREDMSANDIEDWDSLAQINLIIAIEKEFKVKNVIPSDGLPWVPAGIAIFKEAENKDAAKAFVDWALSKEGQEFLKTVAPRMMVRKDVTPPEELKGMTVDKLMKMDIAGMGTRREEILKLWKEKMGK